MKLTDLKEPRKQPVNADPMTGWYVGIVAAVVIIAIMSLSFAPAKNPPAEQPPAATVSP